MITDAIDYLRESDEVWKTVIIGGLLLAFGWLLVPLFLVMGYVVEVIRRTSTGNDDPPVFEDWENLGITGAKAFVIQFAYGLVPLVLATVIVAFGIVGVASGSRGGAAFGGLLVAFGFLVSVVLGLIAAYLAPAAIANFAEKDALGAGFAFGELWPVWTSTVYAKAWLLGFAVVLAAAVVGGVLSAIPILGQLLTAFVTFYALVAAYYIIGHAWGDLADVELHDDRSGKEATA